MKQRYKIIPLEVIKWLKSEGFPWKFITNYVNSIHDEDWKSEQLQQAIARPIRPMFPIGAVIYYRSAGVNFKQISRNLLQDYGLYYDADTIKYHFDKWQKDPINAEARTETSVDSRAGRSREAIPQGAG